MNNKSILYIIGFMGSGKSTTGKKLASLLGWSFIDLDTKIEEDCGKTIPEIFFQFGEDHFRKIETNVLQSLKTAKNTVISTGGGTPCFGNNMDFMLDTGLTIYLKLTPNQLKKRLSGSHGERPLIKEIGDSDLLGYIEEKLAERENWYNRAAIIVDGFNIDKTTLLKLVRKSIE
jgi:shikimate kinase